MVYQCLSSKTSIWFINVFSLFLLFMFFQIFDSALCCPKLRADLKAWVVPHVPPLSCIELCCIQISLMMLDAVPLVILWLRLVMVGSLRRMHYDILRYIRALYDKIWNAKRQNHRAKVHNLQVLPPNKKKCEPAQAFLRSNPRWIWPSPPAELLLKVCALVFEVSWVLTKQGVEFIWSVLMHRCKQNHAQTDTRNRVCV